MTLNALHLTGPSIDIVVALRCPPDLTAPLAATTRERFSEMLSVLKAHPRIQNVGAYGATHPTSSCSNPRAPAYLPSLIA